MPTYDDKENLNKQYGKFAKRPIDINDAYPDTLHEHDVKLAAYNKVSNLGAIKPVNLTHAELNDEIHHLENTLRAHYITSREDYPEDIWQRYRQLTLERTRRLFFWNAVRDFAALAFVMISVGAFVIYMLY